MAKSKKDILYPKLNGKRLCSAYVGSAHTLPKKDSRHAKFARQRAERGFDDTELWSLDHTLAKWMVPRLRLFRKQTGGHPASLTPEAWDAELAKMQRAFELLAREDFCCLGAEKSREVDEGLDSFRQWIHDLWN